MPNEIKTFTHADWLDLGRARFGENFDDWRFVCPICGNVASIGEFRRFKEQGATPESAASECIGRYLPKSHKAFGTDEPNTPKKPCDYAGYGLLRLSPWRVAFPDGTERHSFAFGE